jgi:capsular exopolysaccharide synthesis family protein
MQAQSRPAGLLRTHALLIAAVTILTVIGAITVALLQPAPYVSTAQVEVQPERIPGGTPLAPDMGTEREIALSGTVAETAGENLGLSADSAADYVEVEVPVDTNVLEFSYAAASPERAVLGAEVFTEAYVDYRNGARSSVAHIISDPSVPSDPSRPNLYLILGIALLVGLGLGVALAYAWDRLSPRLRDIPDVEVQTELPVLASIPTLRVPPGEQIVVGSQQVTPGAESYGHLTARLLSMLQHHDARSVVITSPSDGAGKTTVTLNLAASMAAAGKETIVISADARDAALTVRAGVLRRPGLRELLLDKAKLEDTLHETEIEGLRVLPPGGSIKAPHTSLNIHKLIDVLDELRRQTEIVLIEAPSVLGAADTAILAEQSDLTLLVIDIRKGRRDDAAAAVRALSHIGSRLAGCVVNDPGRKHQPPEEPQLSPTFRLVAFSRRGRSKARRKSHEGKPSARPSTIQSRNIEAGSRLHAGDRSAGGADKSSSGRGRTDDRIADVQ